MSKSRKSARTNRKRTDEILANAGIEMDALVPALEARRAGWGSAPEIEAALVEAIGERATGTAAGELLNALSGESADKSVRKQIKRALYRLEQRGQWQRPDEAAAPAPRAVAAEDDEPTAHVSRIDPTGTRLVWAARRAHDGVRSISAVVSDSTGMREAHSGLTTRKALREAMRDLREKTGVALVDVPWQHARRLLADAWERTQDHSRHGDFRRILQLTLPDPGEAAPHPIDALVDRAAAAGDDHALAASGTAVDAPEMAGWLLPLDWITPALEKVEESQSSVVVVSPGHQQERTREAFDDAVASILDTDDRRALFAHRLEESAYLLVRRGEADLARATLAAAEAARGGRSIPEIPLLAELTRRSLALAMQARSQQQQQHQQQQQESSLVLTPAQAMAEQQRRGRR